MDDLPIQLLENIIIDCFPSKECFVEEFINLKLVCKKWNNIINQKSFWLRLCSINEYDLVYILNLLKSKHSKNNYKYSLNAEICIQQNIIRYHTDLILYEYYDIFFEDDFRYLIDFLGGTYKFSQIQYINVSWRLLSMLYSKIYEYDFFQEFKNNMTSNIARGLDDKNRPFIAFKYVNNYTRYIYTEIIYKNDFNEWTFMGVNNSYIGLLAKKNRELSHNSHDYILRMLLKQSCGYIFWKKNENQEYRLYESCKELVVNDSVIPTVELYNSEIHSNYQEL